MANIWLGGGKINGAKVSLLPCLVSHSHVKGFYRDTCENDPEATIRLYEETGVLQAIFDTQVAVTPDAIARLITQDMGYPGDWLLLYTDKGIYWLQYVIPPGGGIPNSIAFADAKGNLLSDRATIDYLIGLWPELSDFRAIIPRGAISLPTTTGPQDTEEVVQVRGSSACFEYQFPSSPEYFVGRQPTLDEVESFTQAVLAKETSCRGILFEAPSGWGKSSVVLASVALLQNMGHFALAIDSRSASSSQFILRVVQYALNKFGDFGGLIAQNEQTMSISGFEGAMKALIDLGQVLERHQKLLFIFLDQFENIFFRQDALSRIRDLFLKVCDVQTNVVLGFSWKNDLIGLTSEFPYQLRDALAGSSKRVGLEIFSVVETTATSFEKLSEELRAPLRKDLEFFLSDFSRRIPLAAQKALRPRKISAGSRGSTVRHCQQSPEC